jgi:hypothetical protein
MKQNVYRNFGCKRATALVDCAFDLLPLDESDPGSRRPMRRQDASKSIRPERAIRRNFCEAIELEWF